MGRQRIECDEAVVEGARLLAGGGAGSKNAVPGAPPRRELPNRDRRAIDAGMEGLAVR